MGFPDFPRAPDIDQGLRRFAETPGALLVDVREADEYARGRIPGSVNVPLSRLETIGEAAADRATPLFVYCLSGSRSRQAAQALARMGYESVASIGGIGGYHGKVERG